MLYTDHDSRVVDTDSLSSVIAGLRYKSKNIKAKADPKFFDAVADKLMELDGRIKELENIEHEWKE